MGLNNLARVLIPLFLVWNLVTFIVMGIDKAKAKRSKWRISEATLMTLAFAFGGIGVFGGMKVFRHKTKHDKFAIGVPVLLVVNILMIIGGYILIQGVLH